MEVYWRFRLFDEKLEKNRLGYTQEVQSANNNDPSSIGSQGA